MFTPGLVGQPLADGQKQQLLITLGFQLPIKDVRLKQSSGTSESIKPGTPGFSIENRMDGVFTDTNGFPDQRKVDVIELLGQALERGESHWAMSFFKTGS